MQGNYKRLLESKHGGKNYANFAMLTIMENYKAPCKLHETQLIVLQGAINVFILVYLEDIISHIVIDVV